MYCKYPDWNGPFLGTVVLIVAKCIVNFENSVGSFPRELVLIVAKCIVNEMIRSLRDTLVTY